MINLFNRFFKKTIVKQVSFYCATNGLRDHDNFINWVNENNVEILNSWTTYHSYSDSHKPQHLNYIIRYKSNE